jgi:YfiH family protein
MMFDMNLPAPGDGFRWVATAAGPALVCDPLAAIVPHLFTTRHWRLGSAADAQDEQAWAEVAEAAGVAPARLLRMRQVHGATVVERSAAEPCGERPEADAALSDDPGAAVAVQTADCVPLLIADGRTGAVAAVHGGWRGTARRIAIEAVRAMTARFGSRPDDLVAAIGPSIGACCYEVGRDVRERFVEAEFAQADIDHWFHPEPVAIPGNPPMPGLASPPRADHWYFDGWTATRDQLVSSGVPAAHIHVARLCTASHLDVLCSYRREGRAAGRLAAAIRATGAA